MIAMIWLLVKSLQHFIFLGPTTTSSLELFPNFGATSTVELLVQKPSWVWHLFTNIYLKDVCCRVVLSGPLEGGGT